MHDIVIIGAGTAGLTAAIYAARAGKSVIVLEGKSYGGQIINSKEIENYPGIKNISGMEFAKNLYEQARDLDAEIKYEAVKGIRNEENKKFVITEKNQYECKSIIIATGAKNRPLGIEDEKRFIGSGISYCATCDGAFFKGKDVAVVGGGNTALEDALFLSGYCRRVYLIHRRDSFRGEKKYAEALKEKENVKFILESNVKRLIGKDYIEGIEIENKISGEKEKIDVEGVFVAIGQIPANEAFANLIETDEMGYIKGDESCRTNIDGIFAAGDCRTKKVRQLATAAADGAVAGLAACEYSEELF